MTRFMGTHHNRLDPKGRVSIPAPFRNVLRAQSGGGALVLLPSHSHPCVEGLPAAAFDRLGASIEQLSPLSEDYEDLALAMHMDAYHVEPDKEGRIVLPDVLIAHGGLADAVVFAGAGNKFEIWEPAAFDQRRAAARERARVITRGGGGPAGIGALFPPQPQPPIHTIGDPA